MSIDQRTEQNHIDTPADTTGASLTSDFQKSETPLTETSERRDHRFHRQEQRKEDRGTTPVNGRNEIAPVEPTDFETSV